MTKDEVRETANELNCKVMEYVNSSDLKVEDKKKILLELSTSLLMSTIDFFDGRKGDDVLKDIDEKIYHIYGMSLIATAKLMSGDDSHILKKIKRME